MVRRDKIEVALNLDLDERAVEEMGLVDVAQATSPELKAFQQWFCSCGNQPLMGIEKSILTTYITWKLLFEGGNRNLLDKEKEWLIAE